MEGDYLSEFGRGMLQWPSDIVIFDNYIYISDCSEQFLYKLYYV